MAKVGERTKKESKIAKYRADLGVSLIGKRLRGTHRAVYSGSVVEARSLFPNWKRKVCIVTSGKIDLENEQYVLYFQKLYPKSKLKRVELNDVTSPKDEVLYSAGLTFIPLVDGKLTTFWGKSTMLTYRPFTANKTCTNKSVHGSVCHIVQGYTEAFTVEAYDLEYENDKYVLKLPEKDSSITSDSELPTNHHPDGAIILKEVNNILVAVGALTIVRHEISAVLFSQLDEFGRQQTRQETGPTITTADDTEHSGSETNSQAISLPGQDLGTRQETSLSVTTDKEAPAGSERREEQVLVDVHVSNTMTDSQPTFLPDQDLGTREEKSSVIIGTTGEATLTGSERREEQAPIHMPNSLRLETTSTLTTVKAALSGRDQGRPQKPRGRQQTSKEASPTIMTADETEYSASETNTCSSSDSPPMSLPCQDFGTRQETSSSVTTDEETSVGSERSEEQAPVHVTNSFISEVTRLQTTSTVTRHEDLPSGREGIPKESRGKKLKWDVLYSFFLSCALLPFHFMKGVCSSFKKGVCFTGLQTGGLLKGMCSSLESIICFIGLQVGGLFKRMWSRLKENVFFTGMQAEDELQENYGFGPLFQRRRGTRTSASVAIIIILGALIIFQAKRGKEFEVVPMGACLGFGELLHRVCLFLEEIGHRKTRYQGKWKLVFQCTFTFRFTLPIGVIVAIIFLLLINFTGFEKIFHVTCSSNYLLIVWLYFVVRLQAPSLVEESEINERKLGNIGEGLAWDYYYQYLRLVLPCLLDRILDSEQFRSKIETKKLFILVPRTCFTYGDINDSDVRVNCAGNLPPTLRLNRCGVKQRPLTNAVQRIEIPRPDGYTDELYCVMEYASPLRTLCDLSMRYENSISSEERDHQVVLFLRKLKEILDDCELCKGKYELVPLSGRKENEISEIVWKIHETSYIELDDYDDYDD